MKALKIEIEFAPSLMIARVDFITFENITVRSAVYKIMKENKYAIIYSIKAEY